MHRTKAEMKWIEGFYLKAFCNGVDEFLFPRRAPLTLRVTVDADPIPFEELSARSFRDIAVGEQWGVDWDSAWFRLSGRVPGDWRGERVAARLHFGGEACVFSNEGEPLQGLTGGSVHLRPFVRDLHRIMPTCQGGEEVELLVEAAANELWGVPASDRPTSPTQAPGKSTHGSPWTVRAAELVVVDEEMLQLKHDLMVLYGLMMDLPEDDAQRARIREALVRARAAFVGDPPDAEGTRRILAPLFAMSASGAEPTSVCVGHAHIDTAWLWPMRETIRKCCRSFVTQLRLLERYPDYVFGASQAPHYLFVKQHYPGLYARIRAAIAEGRWEVQGAMWVESDCNTTGGESLVRQVLYGRRFFREEFGVEVRNAWLPDAFGYPASLPQILRSAGVDFFVTQKMSWNTVNRFPHHTFHWRGIDGTSILSHLLPMETYNAQLLPDSNRFAVRNHEEKGIVPEFLTCFGIGDGGGGPSEEHIEFGLRQRDLAGCPRIEFGSAQSELDRLSEYSAQLSTWDGPLYLERHRGTLTTHALMKRRNRQLENRLRELELRFAARPAGEYPREKLRECWQRLLTNQFHDILPGSSITCVYEDAHQDYDQIAMELDALEHGLADASPSGPLVFNPNGHAFRGVIQTSDGGWQAVSAPALATASLADAVCELAETDAVEGDQTRLENRLVRYEFDDRGRLVSAFDKESAREMLCADAPGNRLTLYEDTLADAWDNDAHFRDRPVGDARLIERRVSCEDWLCREIEQVFEVGASRIRQTVRLRALSRRLDFATVVDWRDRRRQLRVAFPVDLRAREATTEIQFGLQKWSLGENSTWDRGQTDVPAHRFADISEPDCGVALLNDCKYGVNLKDRTLDLNLLRASVHPDPHADEGEHTFTYSLLPHRNRLEDSDVFREAAELNRPTRVANFATVELPFAFESESVILESVKRAEDADALVLRCYEPRGARGTATLTPEPADCDVHEATLLEEPTQALPREDGQVHVQFRPFEIKTLLLLTKGTDD